MIGRTLAPVVALLLFAALTSACAPTPTPSTPSVVASPTPTGPVELIVEPAPGEPIIGTIDSARGTQSTDPVPTRTGRVAVYIRCWGDDIITVEIENSATFTQQCLDEADPGSRNTLDVVGETVRVTGSADSNSLWAIAVTEIPPR